MWSADDSYEVYIASRDGAQFVAADLEKISNDLAAAGFIISGGHEYSLAIGAYQPPSAYQTELLGAIAVLERYLARENFANLQGVSANQSLYLKDANKDVTKQINRRIQAIMNDARTVI